MTYVTKEVFRETSARERQPLCYRVEEQEEIDEDLVDRIEEELKSSDLPLDGQQGTRRDGQEKVH
jgi:hypothetical protein